jgi:hypothetical protein
MGLCGWATLEVMKESANKPWRIICDEKIILTIKAGTNLGGMDIVEVNEFLADTGLAAEESI